MMAVFLRVLADAVDLLVGLGPVAIVLQDDEQLHAMVYTRGMMLCLPSLVLVGFLHVAVLVAPNEGPI